jgi:chaperonin cofactor prefoldin
MGASRVEFRRLNPATGFTAGPALRHAFYQPLPRVDGKGLMRLAGRNIRVPNWVLAISCAVALGVSSMASAGLVHEHTHGASASILPSNAALTNARLLWSGSNVIVQSRPTGDTTPDARIVTLQGQVESMNAELQSLQRDNDALRNLTQQQTGDLSSAREQLAASQDTLNGQSQDMTARLESIQRDLDSRVTTLENSVKSANDAVNQIRKMLGMPAASS